MDGPSRGPEPSPRHPTRPSPLCKMGAGSVSSTESRGLADGRAGLLTESSRIQGSGPHFGGRVGMAITTGKVARGYIGPREPTQCFLPSLVHSFIPSTNTDPVSTLRVPPP